MSVALIESQIRSIEGSIQIANQQLAQARRDGDNTRVAELTSYLAQLQSSLAQAQSNLRGAKAAEGTSSAGQVVAQEQQARAEDSITQNPPPQPEFVQTSTGLNALPEDVEFGTDGRVRPLSETQSTPAPPPEAFVTDINAQTPVAPTAATQGGVGARSDDNSPPTANKTAQIINASFNQRISPQPNVLDQYASYTYSVSWYLLTPDQYNEMTSQGKRNCAGWQLLVQSGGAPTTPPSGTVGIRNKFFNLDYYIDDLEIDSVIPLKGTGAANTATDIKFKLTEPNGITLIENLYKAVSTLYKATNVAKTPNYAMAQYCLVIRFYGYNDFGELQQVGKTSNPGGGTAGPQVSTDVRAVVEKFYPFVISNITFKVANRQIEYQVTAKPIPHFYNKSQDRGTIPFAFELVGKTVSELLIGKPVGTQYPGPDGRASSPTPPAAGLSGNSPVDPVTVTGEANQDLGGGTAFSLGVGA